MRNNGYVIQLTTLLFVGIQNRSIMGENDRDGENGISLESFNVFVLCFGYK